MRWRDLFTLNEQALAVAVVTEAADSPDGAAALAKLVDQRRAMLERYAARRLGPDSYLAGEAEDAVQEMVLIVLRRRNEIARRTRSIISHSLEDRRQMRRLVFTIIVRWIYVCLANVCRNLVRKWYRRRRLLPRISLEGLPHDIPSAEQVDEQVMHRDTCRRITSELWNNIPEKQRRAFLLRHFYGLTTAETAAALGTTEGHIRLMIHRLRTSILERLGTDQAHA